MRKRDKNQNWDGDGVDTTVRHLKFDEKTSTKPVTQNNPTMTQDIDTSMTDASDHNKSFVADTSANE